MRHKFVSTVHKQSGKTVASYKSEEARNIDSFHVEPLLLRTNNLRNILSENERPFEEDVVFST